MVLLEEITDQGNTLHGPIVDTQRTHKPHDISFSAENSKTEPSASPVVEIEVKKKQQPGTRSLRQTISVFLSRSLVKLHLKRKKPAPPTKPTAFTCFSGLPAEIRLMIWELSYPGPRIIKVRSDHGEYWHCVSRWTRPIQPEALSVCVESRLHALKTYEPFFLPPIQANGVFYWDVKIDILEFLDPPYWCYGHVYRRFQKYHKFYNRDPNYHENVAAVTTIRFPIGCHTRGITRLRGWLGFLQGFRGLKEVVLLIPSDKRHRAGTSPDPDRKLKKDTFNNDWIHLLSRSNGLRQFTIDMTYAELKDMMNLEFSLEKGRTNKLRPLKFTIKFEYVYDGWKSKPCIHAYQSWH